MRSASARISSSSTETSNSALPASRSATSRRWMDSIAPMSTPRVGWPRRLEADLSRLHRPDAGERLEQLRLPVAGDAGDADDLAPAHREAHALDALDAEAVFHHEVRHFEHGVTRTRGCLVESQVN